MKTNYHTHTARCMHAVGDDEDYVRSAIKGGFQELGFSDHSPWKYHTDFVSDIRMLPEELPGIRRKYPRLERKIPQPDQYQNRIGMRIFSRIHPLAERNHQRVPVGLHPFWEPSLPHRRKVSILRTPHYQSGHARPL